MPHGEEIQDEGLEARRAIAWTKVAGDLCGLTPEQVAAIPRLVAWLLTASAKPDKLRAWIGEYEELRAIFSPREGE